MSQCTPTQHNNKKFALQNFKTLYHILKYIMEKIKRKILSDYSKMFIVAHPAAVYNKPSKYSTQINTCQILLQIIHTNKHFWCILEDVFGWYTHPNPGISDQKDISLNKADYRIISTYVLNSLPTIWCTMTKGQYLQ
jgi:hypothetical protein